MTDTRIKKEVRHDECGGLAFYSFAGSGEFGTIPSSMVHDLEMPDGSKPPVGEVLTCGACGKGWSKIVKNSILIIVQQDQERPGTPLGEHYEKRSIPE